MDLALLDRDVERCARRVVRARADLALGKTPTSPFERERHVASRATVVSLMALSPSVLDLPQRDALAAWVTLFTVSRVLEDRSAGLAEELTRDAVLVRESAENENLTAKAAWLRMISRPLRAREPLVLALLKRAKSLDGRAVELVAARDEAYRQMNQPALEAQALAFHGAVASYSRQLLKETNELARAFVVRHEASHGEELSPFAAAFDLSLAKEATEGWPQTLSSRWLQGLFPTTRSFEHFAVNDAVNGASYLRGFERLGETLVDRAKTRTFASLVSPFGLERSVMGAALGLLPTRPMFLRRTLELGQVSAEKQAKILETALLFELRRRALVVIARKREDLDGYIEGSRGGLEPLYRLMQPLGLDAESRIAGALFARPFEERLKERFDEDWFRNPRIVPLLREPLTSGILFRGEADEKAAGESATALARSFERSLG